MHKREKYVLYAANLLLYGFTGLYYCFASLYLNKIHSASTAGALLALAQAVAILAPLFWGMCADKVRYKKTVLLIIMIGATAFYCAVPFSNHFAWLAFTLASTMFFLSSLGSVLDVIGMEVAGSGGYKYGIMRLMGMVGYGFVAFGLSLFIGERLNLVFAVCAALGSACCICVCFMPRVKGYGNALHRSSDARMGQKSAFLELFKDTRLLILILVLATAQISYGYYLNFYPTYLTETLCSPTWLWGMNVLLMTVGEAPFYLCFDAIFSRFGIEKIVLCVLALTVARYLLLAIVTSYIGILAIGLFTGMLSVTLLYSVQFFVNKNIKKELRARAQTLVYGLGVCFPRMLAAIIGGFMTERIGTSASLAVCSAIPFIALFALIVFFKKEKIGNRR